MATVLTLQEALKSNRLEDFIAQAEAEGVAAALQAEFDDLVGRVVKAPQPEGQTSHSRVRGLKRGK